MCSCTVVFPENLLIQKLFLKAAMKCGANSLQLQGGGYNESTGCMLAGCLSSKASMVLHAYEIKRSHVHTPGQLLPYSVGLDITLLVSQGYQMVKC